MTPNVGQVLEKKLWNEFFVYSARPRTPAEQAAEIIVKPAFTEGIQGRTKLDGRALFVV
jgi:hypothetical protein